MIGNFLKNILRRDPHRNQRLIVCERCGHQQYESKIAVSTNCKNCRHHIKISGGKAVKSSSKKELASFSSAASLSKEATGASHEEVTEPWAEPLAELGEATEPEAAPPPPAPEEDGKARPYLSRPSRPVLGAKKTPQPEEFSRPQPGMSALNYFREVECFYCHHLHKANRKAKATICPHCESEITLADAVIHDRQTKAVITRGNLIIHKSGFLKAEGNQCCDFRMFGRFEGSIECNDFFVSTTGSVPGTIHCKRLIVEKKCEINFPDPIFAERVEILGKVTGDIHCHGNVKIGARGCVEGSVSAYSVSIEDGGELAGNMNILRRTARVPVPPLEAPVAPAS